jgi:hypothetical protein
MNRQIPSTSSNSLIEDTPDLHGFVMLGVDTLFLYHLPMFSMINHMYQMVVRVKLPCDVLQAYSHDRSRHNHIPYILGNVPADPFTIPQIGSGSRSAFLADIFRGPPKDPTRDVPLLHQVDVQIERVVFVRHFDFVMPYPPTLTYIVFGSLQRAYAAHYLTKSPDFDHVCELTEVPGWISAAVLNMGAEVNVSTLSSNVSLTEASQYEVTYFGQSHGFPLNTGSTVWLDKEMVNAAH